VVTVTGGSNKRISLAALIAIKPGCRPRLIYRVHNSRRGKDQRKGFTEADYARLLDAAHQQLTGPILVVWDNLNSHVSAAMTGLAAARDWLTVCQLPPYAHELNPVELVWSHLKRSLANLAKRNLAQLTALVKTRLKRMQYRPGLLDGFLASTGLDLTPFCNPSIRVSSHGVLCGLIHDLLAQAQALGTDPVVARRCHGRDLVAALPAPAAPFCPGLVADLADCHLRSDDRLPRRQRGVRPADASAADEDSRASDKRLHPCLVPAAERAGLKLSFGGLAVPPAPAPPGSCHDLMDPLVAKA
jgi:hypothetical protein